MGGYGSGWHRGSRYTADGGLGIHVGWIVRQYPITEGGWIGSFSWTRRGEVVGSCGYILRRDSVKPISLLVNCNWNGKPFKQELELSHVRMPKGGLKTYLICPYCRTRRMKLYFSRLPSLCCRKCANYTYESCQQSKKWSGIWQAWSDEIAEEVRWERKWDTRTRQRERCKEWRERSKVNGLKSTFL